MRGATRRSTSDRELSDSERHTLARDGLQRIDAILKSGEAEPTLNIYLAIEIWNILNNSAIRTSLKKTQFPTPAMYKDGNKMFSLFPLVTIKFNKDPPRVSFASIASQLPSGMRYDLSPFQDWWKKEVIHQPMRPPGDPEKIEVIDLTRFGVVRMIRNKMAAHHDHVIPRLLSEIDQALMIERWTFNMDGKPYRLGEGGITVEAPYINAVLRQISYEILTAFGTTKLA